MENLIPSLNGAATQEEVGTLVTTEDILETVGVAPVETVAIIEDIAPAAEPVAEVEDPILPEPEVILEPVAEPVSETESEVVYHKVTEEDLAANPELSDVVSVGDAIGIPEPSLVDQFKAQAEIADQADPELDITDLSIKEQILDHLQFQDKDMWTNISPLLLTIAKTESVTAIKTAIIELLDEKKIKYHANAHEMWGTPSGSDNDHKTTYHTIDNLNLYVKLV